MNRQKWKKYGFMAEVIVLTLTAALCWRDVSQGAFAAGRGTAQAENNSASESAEDSGTDNGGDSGTDNAEDSGMDNGGNSGTDSAEKDYIKWVDFHVTSLCL